jgi:hypothetical protein
MVLYIRQTQPLSLYFESWTSKQFSALSCGNLLQRRYCTPVTSSHQRNERAQIWLAVLDRLSWAVISSQRQIDFIDKADMFTLSDWPGAELGNSL